MSVDLKKPAGQDLNPVSLIHPYWLYYRSIQKGLVAEVIN